MKNWNPENRVSITRERRVSQEDVKRDKTSCSMIELESSYSSLEQEDE
jgi:hypothetical protein